MVLPFWKRQGKKRAARVITGLDKICPVNVNPHLPLVVESRHPFFRAGCFLSFFLAFQIPRDKMRELLSKKADASFNCISIDSDTSTSVSKTKRTQDKLRLSLAIGRRSMGGLRGERTWPKRTMYLLHSTGHLHLFLSGGDRGVVRLFIERTSHVAHRTYPPLPLSYARTPPVLPSLARKYFF